MSDDNPSDTVQTPPSNPIETDQILWAVPKPNWDEWNKVKQARLWQAVALACNIDPSNFQFNGPNLVRLFSRPTTEFEDLLSMAKANIGAGGILKLVSLSDGGLEESEVKLSNFATWLKTTPHIAPPEFPWQPEAMPLSNMDWPWGRHETDLLRKLAAVANRFWKNYDPSDPTTAPTNQEVIDWLREKKVATRTAEIIATILRADNLPMGPRK
jgi:hypothetical protein